ncbi:hypothetical protein H2201_006247 [Coniosporium apollinis]|uniref:DUF7514 domain-containing protein n=1 Tax=Coniosporium apollinis TaxID=61459 RepID=A0ABQ9NPW7_9PEZI|nr:hypothetical protein H2201_006247 [Coniosporium apollinis]
MAEPVDAQAKEAFQYWGYLFKPDKCGTELLNRLLAGIADFISRNLDQPSDEIDITPSQLAAFYRAVGGDYDILFIETPPQSMAFIYKSLGCLHSLQPAPTDDGYGTPNIPALKKKGFVTWQTIQLLLGPEEHVPFLQNAVATLGIIDPSTGQAFPKLLPTESFPREPDADMVRWYEGVSERLRQQCEAEEQQPGDGRPGGERRARSSEDSSADERSGAAAYFRDPLYRNHRDRPTMVRRYSKNPPRSPREFIKGVRHAWAPHLPWHRGDRQRNFADRYTPGDGDDEEDATPMGLHRYATAPARSSPPSHQHQAQHSQQQSYQPQRPAAPSRQETRIRAGSLVSTESTSDSDTPSQTLRHRRSHEPPHSPREYFPHIYEPGRRYSADYGREGDVPPAASAYGPSKAPLFAAQVAQLQPAHAYYANYGRPVTSGRSSYSGNRPVSRYKDEEGLDGRRRAESWREGYVRGAAREPSWERERERGRHRGERDRDRVRMGHRHVQSVDGVGGRRYPAEAPWR